MVRGRVRDGRPAQPGAALPAALRHGAELGASDASDLASRGFRQSSLGGATAWTRGGTGAQPAYTVVWSTHGEVLTLVTDDAADPAATATLEKTFAPYKGQPIDALARDPQAVKLGSSIL